jgi:uroporphyrinogen decarboxylase
MLGNDLLIRAAKGEKTERIPVWVMRQAGRILPEYRATRAQAGSFINLVTNPELAAEVTVQPVDILGVDAAIIFSDILVIPEAMGLPYQMDEGKGPFFPKTIQRMEDVDALEMETIASHLSYVKEALEITLEKLEGRVPLIGFAGAPWTIFCYMIEGKGSKEFSKARKVLIEQPELAQALLTKISTATIAYAQMQINTGIHLFQLFDSWAGVLNAEWYKAMILPHVERILSHIHKQIPVTFFAKGAHYALPDFKDLSCHVIGLDWNMDIDSARKLLPAKTLQGNLDPAILYGSDEQIIKSTLNMVEKFGKSQYIANLGHGVYPDMNPKKLKLFIETIQNA